MSKLDNVKRGLRQIQESGISITAIEVSKKDREELIFNMMQMARGTTNPTREMASRHMGAVTIYGIEIKETPND